MIRVLVTRARPEAEETAAELRAAGHEHLIAPLRDTVPLSPDWPDAAPDSLVATSRNAFRQPLPQRLRALPCFVVGASTGRAAQDAGVETVITGPGEVMGLIDTIRAHLPAGAALLYLTGDPRRPELERELASAGYHLRSALLYRMAPLEALPEALKTALIAGALDATLHFSAESARHFAVLVRDAGLAEAAKNITHFCLSPAVAEAIRQALAVPDKKIRVAAHPDAASLLSAIENAVS